MAENKKSGTGGDDPDIGDLFEDNDEQGAVNELSGAGTELETGGEDSLPGENLNIFQQMLYTMRLRKGTVSGTPVLMWDKVRECRILDCKLFHTCPYFDSKVKIERAMKYHAEGRSLGSCRVEQKFLCYVQVPFMELLMKHPDPFVMQDVGLKLMPMYHTLVQLLMEKAGVKDVSYCDSKGIKRINPVYDQIDRTLKSIAEVWKGPLAQYAKDAGYFKTGKLMTAQNSDDLDDYDMMSRGVGDFVPYAKHKESAKKTAVAALKTQVAEAKAAKEEKKNQAAAAVPFDEFEDI